MFDLPRLREGDSGNDDDESQKNSSNATTITRDADAASINDINKIVAATDDSFYQKQLSREKSRTEYDAGTPLHFRKMRKAYSSNDVKSLSIRSTNFYRSVSFIPDHNDQTPPPTSKQDKIKMSRRYFATVTGMSYAIFLVVFGAIVFIGDAIVDQTPLPEILIIYMLVVSFAYFLYLYIDIRLHIRKAKRAITDREKRLKIFEQALARASVSYETETIGANVTPIGETSTDERKVQMPYENLPPLMPVSHRYCFMTGRHGEFFYLKIGAAWFAIGLLIDSILQIAYQIIYLSSEEHRGYDCASALQLTLEILFPIYSLFILFFIYKYINIIINERRGLARLMLMHAIGTSLAYWIYTIVRETTDAIMLSEDYKMYHKKGHHIHFNVSHHEKCLEDGNLNYIRRTFTPYLYPFIIEFSILIVGIWYIIWSHINSCPKKQQMINHDTESVLHGQDNSDNNTGETSADSKMEKNSQYLESEHDIELNTNSFIYADCHATHRGLFGGMILIVATIVFIILFFVAVNNEGYLTLGILINSIFELTVLVIMILVVLAAYYQISKLDINTHPASKLDDVLLFIAIPAFFMETILSLAPAIYLGSTMHILIAIAQIVQVLLQTPFIIDGLRRCANTRNLRKKKPGRELVMFITIANISLWIFYTFSVKGTYKGDHRYDFYGYTAWNILSHISLPLIMFYRFHSSVCLVDIWRHSYEPAPIESNH